MTDNLIIVLMLATLAFGFFYVGFLAGYSRRLKYYSDRIEFLEKENHRLYWRLIEKGEQIDHHPNGMVEGHDNDTAV